MVHPIPVSGRRPYTSDMPPERFDWSERQQSQAVPPSAGYAPAGPSPAGLAQAGPPATPGSPAGKAPPSPGGTAASPLMVRTQRSEHTLQPGTVYRIGRDPKSDISMTDSRVSWQHGVFKVAGDKWVFEDVGSTNGTFLGQQKVDRVEISAECTVHLGNPDDGPVLRCVPQAAPAGLNIGTVRAAPIPPAAPGPSVAPAGPPTPVEPIQPIPSAGAAAGSPWWSGSPAESGGPSAGSLAPPPPAPSPPVAPPPSPAPWSAPAPPPAPVPAAP